MHAELSTYLSINSNGFAGPDHWKAAFASENKAAPVEKISSSGIRDIPISSDHVGTQMKREN
jgi:hypothetical protein